VTTTDIEATTTTVETTTALVTTTPGVWTNMQIYQNVYVTDKVPTLGYLTLECGIAAAILLTQYTPSVYSCEFTDM